MMSQAAIPDKLYFKIGEVADLAGVQPYVLRYWETEFKEICPVKSRSNQRLYRRRDVETVLSIKHLLYDEGFTIEGARKRIREQIKPEKEVLTAQQIDQMAIPFDSEDPKFLKLLRDKLQEILKILEG